MTKKKIMLIMILSTPRLGSRSTGGVDSVCQDLLLGLIKRKEKDREYLIIGFDPTNNSLEDGGEVILSANMRLRHFNFYCNRKSFFSRFIPNFVFHNLIVSRETKSFRPDVIHVHQYSWLLHNNITPRRVLTLHSYGDMGRTPVNILNDWIYKGMLTRIGIRNADRLTTVSKEIEVKLKEAGYPAFFIANPVNSSFFEVTRTAEKLSEDPSIVVAGALVPGKRIIDSLKIVLVLKEAYPKVKLYVAGRKGENSNYYNELCDFVKKNSLHENIEFMGNLNVSELRALYEKAWLGMAISKYETFGLSCLEMMAAGLPVIFTSVGVMSIFKSKLESMSDSHRIDVGDVQEAVTICKNIFIKRFIKNGESQDFVRNNFSVEQVLTDYDKMYR